MPTAHLLVVEDDPGIGANLERALSNSGYGVTLVTTVADSLAVTESPDLVLLDLGLPDGDGFDLARTLGDRWPQLPIVILTARTEEMDVVIGLDVGAVDYVTKPFRLAELLARVRAHLRQSSVETESRQLRDGELTVDLDSRRVILDGSELQLRAKEFDLMVELLSHRGKVVTRQQLIEHVWDSRWRGSTKTLDVHIAALRRHLGEEPGASSRIVALRGVGYRWDPVSPEG
jgi:DNA-binding response OmpR family regulator